jgi:hypothetical protein
VHLGVVVEIDWFIHSKDLIEISKISRLVNVARWFSIESLVIFGLATASEITCHYAIGLASRVPNHWRRQVGTFGIYI